MPKKVTDLSMEERAAIFSAAGRAAVSRHKLTDQEIEDLRRETREAGQMMKDWLRKKREQNSHASR